MKARMFKFDIDNTIEIPNGKEFIIVGIGQYKGLHENRYLCQPIVMDFDLDFTQCTWFEESKIKKSQD